MLKKKIIPKTFLVFVTLETLTLAGESGGMPQLNPEFWISQIFWLILTFGILFITLSKFILPNISSNLETRKSQILENIEMADKQRLDSENKIKDYDRIIQESKNEAKNIINDAKTKLTENISRKKNILDDEINSEIENAEKEVNDLLKKSSEKINQIAIDTSSDLIKQLINTDINKSNISAIVEDLQKKGSDKYNGI